MDGMQFDRIARTLAGLTPRRRLLAALGVLVLPRTAPAQAASQIAMPACAAAGSVCTLIRGCCTGLVCATSYINTSYGVCVAGEGGMLPVSDDIVMPSSDGIETELAQEVADVAATATVTTDPDVERQARIDARRAKNSTQRTTRKTNRNTRQTEKQTKRNTQQLNGQPKIALELFQQNPPPPTTAVTGEPETVRVRNHDDVSVVLTHIGAMDQPHIASSLSVTIPAGGTYLLEAGKFVPNPAPSTSVATIWTKETVCPQGRGINLTANQTGGTKSHLFSVLCGASADFASTDTRNNKKQKRKRSKARKDRRNRRKNTRKG